MKFALASILIMVSTSAVFAQQSRRKPVAENFIAVDINGDSVELKSLIGKVVVLTFWSTKCAICVAEIPNLNKLSMDNKDKNVVFLGLTMNNEATVNAFLKKKPFNFRLLPDSFGVVLKYADKDNKGNIAMGFPAHFLINQNGEVELKTSGFDKTKKLSSEIDRLLLIKKPFED